MHSLLYFISWNIFSTSTLILKYKYLHAAPAYNEISFFKSRHFNSPLVTMSWKTNWKCYNVSTIASLFNLQQKINRCIIISIKLFVSVPLLNYKKHCTKNQVFLKDFFSKCDQIRMKLRIWSRLLQKSWMENFIFCAAKCALHQFSYPFFHRLVLYFRD